MKKLTNWTQATRNPFKAIKKLIGCLQYGYVAWIEIQENGKQDYPIYERVPLNNIDAWESSHSYGVSNWEEEKQRILENKFMHPTQKDLTLNYRTVFGTEEEYKNYLKTGKIKFSGMGKTFFVKNHNDNNSKFRFVPYVTVKPEYKNKIKKGKVFVICYYNYNEKQKLPFWIKLFNFLTYPFKFIPVFSKLKMDTYTNYEFSVGSVRNGFSVEFKIPKKFSFKD